jgi:hypothetical protein
MVFLLIVVAVVVVAVAVIGIVSGGIWAFPHRIGGWSFFLIRLRRRPHTGNGSLEVASFYENYDRTVEAQGNERDKPTESIIHPYHRRVGYRRRRGRRGVVPPQQQSRKLVVWIAGPDYRPQDDHDELMEDNAQARIPGDHPAKEDAAALWLAAGGDFVDSATSCFFRFVLFLRVVVFVDRLEVVLEETLGALLKGPIFFIRPPLVQALAVDPLAPTLAPTRSDHCFGAVFYQTNPAHLFVVVVFGFIVVCVCVCVFKSAAPNPLKGGSLKIQLTLVDVMVIVDIAVAVAIAIAIAVAIGLESSSSGGKNVLEITHGCLPSCFVTFNLGSEWCWIFAFTM